MGRKGRRRETDLKVIALVQLRNGGGRRCPCLLWMLVFLAHKETTVASLGSNSVRPELCFPVEVLLSWGNKFSFDRAELLHGKKIFCKCIIKPS